VSSADKNGCTGLMLAAWGGHEILLEPLVRASANVDHRDFAGRTALMRASQWGHAGAMHCLISLKATVDLADSNGCTALTLAAQWGHNDAIERLLIAGAAVDREDKNDCTALTWAAREGRSDVIERLLAAGAVVDQKNNDGRTALMRSAYEGRTEVIERLLKAGAVTDRADKNGCTALMHAAVAGHGEAIERLLACGAVVDTQDSIGWTALMYAAYGGHGEAIGRLLAAGADISARNLADLTAADIAEREGNYDVVALLVLPRESLATCTAIRQAVQDNDVQRVRELRSSAPLDIRRWVLRVFCESRRCGRRLRWLRLRRSLLFEDLVEAVMDPSVCDELWRGFAVKFVGEPGVDEGGLTREMFELFAAELASRRRGLFRLVKAEDPSSGWKASTLQAEPCALLDASSGQVRTSPTARSILQLYRACGRITALALATGNLVEAYARFHLKGVLGDLEMGMEDLTHEDPALARTLSCVLTTPLEELGVEPTFSCTISSSEEMLGMPHTVELMPDGASLDVTDENKADWVARLIQHKLDTCIADQRDAFRDGMLDVLPEAALQLFDADELQRELAGEGLDSLSGSRLEKMMTTWKRHTEYEGGYTAESRVVRWFWDLLESRDAKCSPGAVLRFVTGRSRISEAGFEALRPRFCIVQAGNDEEALPSAATCLNLLRLPEYTSKETLRSKLAYALEHGGGYWTA